MSVIEKFLGKRVVIPDELRYQPNQGLWAKPENNHLTFGLTEPALVLSGGISDLDWLAPEEQMVSKGQSIVFAITGKILYIEAPTGGTVHYNPALKEDLSLILEDPYGKGWLFKIKTEGSVEKEFENFVMNEVAPLYRKMKGQDLFLGKGYVGQRTGQYAIFITFETVDDRNNIYPLSGGFSEEFNKVMEENEGWYEKFQSMAEGFDGIVCTDYIKVGQ